MITDLLKFTEESNTINGGVVSTSVAIEEKKDRLIFKVKTPGVSESAYNIEIQNNLILVEVLGKNQYGDVIQVPIFKRFFEVPYFIDGNEIEALFDENKVLSIQLPFKEGTKLKRRKINIRKN